MKDKKNITLMIADEEIVFFPDVATYNKYINEMTMNNKIAPAYNFLMRTVEIKYKEALEKLLQQPGAILQIMNKLLEAYTPELEIIIKN